LIRSPSRDEFVNTFGHLFEYSPWVVERAWKQQPFADEAALHAAFMKIVMNAPSAEQLALIRAHPQLGIKTALTADSEHEQSGAGLKSLSQQDFETFSALNAAYNDKFGFPFIICVRLQTKASILAAFKQRLLNDAATEHQAALTEIGHITRLRLQDMKLGVAA
jgi:OHCU decarboxylase